MIKEISFEVASQTHEGVIIGADVTVPPNFVFIHGAGMGTFERAFTFSDAILEKGGSILAFNQSGAGKDAENILQSSLERRTAETKEAIKQFAAKDNLTISGSSMGGHIALRMLEYFPIKNIVLFCPAIYNRHAFTVKFGANFREAIKPGSWRDSEVLELLDEFSGRILIVIGEEDEVIPPGVVELLEAHSSNASQKEILRVPGAPHQIHFWLEEHPKERRLVAEKVAEFAS